jgi:predicted dehydrogenase
MSEIQPSVSQNPVSQDPVRWGVAGTGFIADFFCTAVAVSDGAEVAAVASRSAERARIFAEKWEIGSAYGDYAALGADTEVDAVYVATPHPDHLDTTVMSLKAGKHVLCEKPLALNRAQAQAMVDTARQEDRFLMEAIWTRFFPAWREIDRLLAEGAIGELRSLHAGFGFAREYDPAHRLFAPELGGGALLDLGLYPVSVASRHLGALTLAGAAGRLAPNGVVDAHTSAVVVGETGAVATLSCGSQEMMDNRAVLTGSAGRIEVERFWCPTGFTLHRDGAEPEEFTYPNRANGMEHEVEAVSAHIARGERESPLVPLEESLRIAAVLDDIRGRIGVRYPQETAGERK